MDVLVLLAGSGDCALFLVLKYQPCDYFSFFSSSVVNPLHHMQNLCCGVLVCFICISAGCGTNLVCPFAPAPSGGTFLSEYPSSPGAELGFTLIQRSLLHSKVL